MNELSLFSGAGGGLLATKHLLGWKTIGYVEINDYCQRVIQQRIIDGFLDQAPIFGDVKAFISEGYAEVYKGMVDVITAGPPCQPYSVAGLGGGERDQRDMLSYTIDTIRIVEPQSIVLENVPNFINYPGFSQFLGSMAEIGYCVPWDSISAGFCGAPHFRKRLWVCANANSNRLQRINTPTSSAAHESQEWIHIKRMVSEIQQGRQNSVPESWILRKDHGISNRMERIKAIGEGQVPRVVEVAWEVLKEE